jgi:hypothetical protein
MTGNVNCSYILLEYGSKVCFFFLRQKVTNSRWMELMMTVGRGIKKKCKKNLNKKVCIGLLIILTLKL